MPRNPTGAFAVHRLKTWVPVLGAAFLSALLFPASAVGEPRQNDGQLHIGGGTITLALDPGLSVSPEALTNWVQRAGDAVTHYLRHFPVKHIVLTIKAGHHGAIGGGVTYGGSRITVRLGPDTTPDDLMRDWVLTHEMFHLAFPTLDDRYLWMMEGLSDYLEPVARARVGQLTPEAVWREMVEGLPQGLPESGGEGLDGTTVRERIYWGGDLFWLLADVRIRAQTNNRRSVDDVVRSIVAAGGTGGVDWSLEDVLRAGDKATGTAVLQNLHDELGPQPGKVDLGALWKRLGISYHFGAVHFDDSAPWANIRTAITAQD